MATPADRELQEDMLRDDLRRQAQQLQEIRSLASELYGDRGEDARTAQICNEIMRIAEGR